MMGLKQMIIVITVVISVSVAYGQEVNDLLRIFNQMTSNYNQFNHQHVNSPDWNYWLRPVDSPPKKRIGHQYDFIVVGSGSAGAVLASRLSEVPHWRVLLLEAGKRENYLTRIPIAAPLFQFTDYDWHYFMERQPGIAKGLENERMYWPRGRALGGSTVINYMIYTRGNPRDYDRWEAQGNPGWGYKDVLPYFMKSESAKLKYGDYRYHGRDGYLSVEDIYQSPTVKAFVKAGQEMGLPHIDYNSPVTPLGVSTIQATVLNGERHTVARAFLDPVKQRPNLHILTSAYVTRLLIDPVTKVAYGVEYERKGKRYSVGASKEVILSAGAFSSPQLLMLSGIGPKNHLQELGISLLQNLPGVGQNLHDHICYPALAFLIDKPVSVTINTLLDVGNIASYLSNRTGPYTSLGGVEGIGYIHTPVSQDPPDYPDMELLFVGATLASDLGILSRSGMRIRDDIYDKLLAPLHGQHAWTIFPMMLHPKSTGYLKLKSKNPFEYPLFYGNYFSHPQDLATLLAAIRFISALARTPSFQRLNSRLNPRPVPGCEQHLFDSDPYWECALRSLSVTLHHQVGTCKMGPRTDPQAVVDHELRVHGVRGLRVADTSVIPFALSAHTSTPAIMIGEKTADVIKNNWRVNV